MKVPTEAERHANDLKYEPWIVCLYTHWTLYLNDRDQGLPGRVYAWLKHHEDHMAASELTGEELDEFYHRILPDVDAAIRSIGWPLLRLNHEWLGNEVEQHGGHGHYHVTPRYERTFAFDSLTFEDTEPNKRRSVPKLTLNEDQMLRMRELFRHHLHLVRTNVHS